MPKVTIGTTFFFHHADSRPEWKVTKKRGVDTFEATIISEDWQGTTKVFGVEEIISAINADNFWESFADENQRWWAERKIGEIVHYHNGFGEFVRGEIIETPEGMKMKPTALVGNWREGDLPHYDRYGNLCEGYHAREIREGKVFQPNASNMWESPTFSRRNDIDPTVLPAISLEVKGMSSEQKEIKALSDQRKQILAALELDHSNIDIAGELRKALARVKVLINV